MAGKNFKNKEKAIGKRAANTLNFAIKSLISSSYIETSKSTGALLRLSNVKPRFDKDSLQRIVIEAPRHGFILNYGFSGTTEKGYKMHLKPTNHLHNAIERSKALEILATQLSELRADEVISHINF